MQGTDIAPPCGWHCEDCPYFHKECRGCRQTNGKPFWTSTSDIKACPIYRCCTEQKKLEHCGLCPYFPCEAFIKWRDPSMSDEEFEKFLTGRVEALRSRAGK